MEIDNNHLVTKYYDLQAKNAKVFKAVEQSVNDQVAALYRQLDSHFVDTLTLSIDDAVSVAKAAGLDIDPAEAEIAVTNFILKDLTTLGLWIQPLEESDPNTIVAKLNFGNRSRYY
ncbi:MULTISPECIES: hypothetical protein [Lacticaseibacillus]|uniref:Uncharacterized protein n=2 Tax=Lacticaseibacillus TaxID=2759736 RepID=A0ABW4CGU6_9LACO|nr:MULTISPECIES: hypothetical protein [Lacticaseibacillus]